MTTEVSWDAVDDGVDAEVEVGLPTRLSHRAGLHLFPLARSLARARRSALIRAIALANDRLTSFSRRSSQ